MATAADVLTTVLNFSDKQFYTLDMSTLDNREADLRELPFYGIAINAPDHVINSQTEQLPLLLALRSNAGRVKDYPLEDHCVLVGMNLTDGSVYLVKAVLTEKDTVSRLNEDLTLMHTKPPARGLETEGVVIYKTDVRSQLPIPWQTGTWSFTALYYDWPSNSTLVNLKDPGNPKPEVSPKPIEPLPHPKRGSNLPCYQHHPKSPPIPAKGAYFRIVNEAKQSAIHWSVYCAFNFKFRPAYIPEVETKHAFRDGTVLTVSAVIPVTFVLLCKTCNNPEFRTWTVPFYGPMLNPGETGQAYFAIEITKLISNPEDSGYVSYLLIDGKVYGPEIIQADRNDAH